MYKMATPWACSWRMRSNRRCAAPRSSAAVGLSSSRQRVPAASAPVISTTCRCSTVRLPQAVSALTSKPQSAMTCRTCSRIRPQSTTPARRLAAEEDVLGHGEARHHGVLEHGGNMPARSASRTGITLGDTRAIALLAVSAVLFALLVVIETRTHAPCDRIRSGTARCTLLRSLAVSVAGRIGFGSLAIAALVSVRRLRRLNHLMSGERRCWCRPRAWRTGCSQRGCRRRQAPGRGCWS